MKDQRARVRKVLGCATTVAVSAAILAGSGAADAAPRAGLVDVMLIGNSAAGTVSFLDQNSFAVLGSVNVIPDLQQRLDEMNLVERAGYEVVKQQEGGDRWVDDAYLSPDGRTLYVSRGNLDDVAAFDVATKQQLWHRRLEGFKADHAALSPDGKRIVVSATTAKKAQVLDTATGAPVGEFATGTYPHQNDYSADGKYIYNSSIGVTVLPKLLDSLKGEKFLTVVDAATLQVVKTYQFDKGVRPSAFTPDGRTMYTQLSYLNGFVEFDLSSGKIVKTVQMPFSDAGKAKGADDYPQNSAHHGLALSGDQKKLCTVGTIDDYTAVVSRPNLTTDGYVHYPVNSLPYWATTSTDGRYCYVTLSNLNAVSVVDYSTSVEVVRIPVGDFPQRVRRGRLPSDVIGTLTHAVTET